MEESKIKCPCASLTRSDHRVSPSDERYAQRREGGLLGRHHQDRFRNKKTAQVRILGLGCLLLLTACVSERKRETLEPQEPAAQVVKEQAPVIPQPPEPVKLTPAEEQDLVKIREWTQLGQPLSEADREFLRDPGPLPPVGSTKEAVMAFGYVKLVHSRGVGPSLEQYAREYRVPLADVLRSNPHATGVQGAQLVVEAMTKIPVSEGFYRKVVEALRAQSAGWPKDSPPVDAILPPPPGSMAVPFAPQSPGQAGEDTGIVRVTPTPSEPGERPEDRSDKGVLDLAQQLADQGLFGEAILKLDQISSQSHLRLLALQRIKEYSQNGIQGLRRRAALAFQNANVAPDEKTRLEYLKSARQLLEDGLIMFPEAPQAHTVRENLKALSMQIRQPRSR